MDKSTYLLDPCGASSLPFWKTNTVAIPDDLLILRGDDPRLKKVCHDSSDTPYFKLIHHMQDLRAPILPEGYRFIGVSEKVLSDHIASCYKSERVSEAELAACRNRQTFFPDLWLAILDDKTGNIVASGIGELDTSINEGILEWIQVSPAHRRKGWGRAVVHELLFRMQGRADFVTVSGKLHSPDNPRALYEQCGFGGCVIWHIIKLASVQPDHQIW